MVGSIGKFIVSVSEDESLKVWQVNANSEKCTVIGKNFHQAGILSLSLHETRPIFATGGQDQVICVGNLESGDVYFRSPQFEDAIEAVCISSQ